MVSIYEHLLERVDGQLEQVRSNLLNCFRHMMIPNLSTPINGTHVANMQIATEAGNEVCITKFYQGEALATKTKVTKFEIQHRNFYKY